MRAYIGQINLSSFPEIGYDDAQGQLDVSWPANREDLYTLYIYDRSANNYIHFLGVNIPGNNINEGLVVYPYVSPNPPSGIHEYVIQIYQQGSRLNPPHGGSRIGYDTSFLSSLSGKYMGTFRVKAKGSDKTVTWFPEDTSLTKQQQKYCRCVLKVAGKQSTACNTEKAWYQSRGGTKCYNPYAVCAKSTKTSSRECGSNYKWEDIPDKELMAYASLSRIPIPDPYTRRAMLDNIMSWKSSLGK